jgi:hypothetical protein
MKTRKTLKILFMVSVLPLFAVCDSWAAPMGTAFTYQGRLIDANKPADGLYDFQFKLFDANVAGVQKGSTIDINELDVIDGLFTVLLDFGSGVFDGNTVWLEIGVRPGDLHDPNVYTILSQRQEITAVPYALQTRGIFVDNAGSVGIGTVSPTAKLDVHGDVSTDSVYKIGGITVLSVIGNYNILVGKYAGYSNTTGKENTFLGHAAGRSNTTGYGNTFSGQEAGYSNTTGYYNTFSGRQAGCRNTIGYDNTFLGSAAGFFNTEGYANTFLGKRAGYSNTAGFNNTFSGYEAGYSNTVGYDNTFSGYQAGYYTTEGPNNTFSGYQAGYSNTTGFNNTFSGYQAGYSNSTGKWNMFSGSQAGYSNTTGYGNMFSGYHAGYYNTTGSYNTFSGYCAGRFSSTGNNNTFSGCGAGSDNTGNDNTFVGFSAGFYNRTASYNTFLGCSAGLHNTTGSGNTFSGREAGYNNDTGYNNIFSGVNAGYRNREGWGNTFSGWEAGYSNLAGSGNTFSGYRAGYSNQIGNGNVFIGYGAGYFETGSDKLYIANESSDNRVLIYGDFSTGKVGLGTKTLNYRLQLPNTADAGGQGCANAWQTYSSKRWKTNVEPIGNALEKVKRLQGVYFDWKSNGKHDIGLIAEEVAKVIPEVVGYSEDGKNAESLDYPRLVALLVEAVKQQQKQTEELQKEIAELKMLVKKVDQ